MSLFLPQSPMGSGLALAISQASHFLQPPPHQSIIIERMHSGMSCRTIPYWPPNLVLKCQYFKTGRFWNFLKVLIMFHLLLITLGNTSKIKYLWKINWACSWVCYVFPPRSSPFCNVGLWPSCFADGCSDPHLWRPGLSVHRHLDSGWGGGWPQAGGGHRHQHPLPHSAWPAATTCLQVHEGLFLSVLLWGRVVGWLTWCFKFLWVKNLPQWWM